MRISYFVPAIALAVGIIGYGADQDTTNTAASCCDGDVCMTSSPKSAPVLTLADIGASAAATAPAAVDVGNTKCIIETDQEASAKVTYTYNNKIYHFCCADCIDDFKKDPEKYVKAINANPAKWGIKK